MNRNRWMTLVLAIAFLSAVALTAFNTSLDAQDKKASPDKKPAVAVQNNPFAGKVLLIQKKDDQSPSVIRSPSFDMGIQGYVLENAAITEVAGIRFLTGHGIERVDDKPAGPRIRVALEIIGAILEFDNVDAFKEFEEQQSERMHSAIEMQPGMPVPFDPAMPEPEAAPDA